MDENIPGLNEIIPPGGRKRSAAPQPGPQPAPRTSPEAQPAAAPSPAPSPPPVAAAPAPQAPGQSAPVAPTAASSFDLNQPTIVAGLYLSAPFFGVTGLIGLVLAYVWRSEKPGSWEATHYTYLIRGFWMWFVGFVVGFILTFVVIGIFIILAAYALIIVRAVLSIMRAQKQEPMPEPETWLV